MRSKSSFVLVLLGISLVACGGPSETDAGPNDARVALDEGLDGGAHDAAEPIDVALPTDDVVLEVADGSVDATVPADAFCASADRTEICNAFDDDCDGRVDEAGCNACTAAVGPGDTVYLFCTRMVNGFDAWADACPTLGPGYRLVDLDSVAEEVFVTSTTANNVRWVGLRGFGRMAPAVFDSAGLARDLATVTATPDDTRLTNEDCFALTSDGIRSDLCDGSVGPRRGVICEAPVAAARPSGVPETCNGLDDDADGRIDDGVCPASCTAIRFATQLYYRCDEPQDWNTARATCETLGGSLATIESFGENRFYTSNIRATGGVTWIGATDDAERLPGAEVGQYRWLDGRLLSEGFTNWRDGNPDGAIDNEHCAAMNTTGAGDEWVDTSCTRTGAFGCEVGTTTVGP